MMLPRGGPTKRRGEEKSWKICEVYPELRKLGNEKEFFFFLVTTSFRNTDSYKAVD